MLGMGQLPAAVGIADLCSVIIVRYRRVTESSHFRTSDTSVKYYFWKGDYWSMKMDRPWDVDRPILIDGSSWTSWPPLCGALALLYLCPKLSKHLSLGTATASSILALPYGSCGSSLFTSQGSRSKGLY